MRGRLIFYTQFLLILRLDYQLVAKDLFSLKYGLLELKES